MGSARQSLIGAGVPERTPRPPRTLRRRLRRLRTRLSLARAEFGMALVPVLAASGGATVVVATFELENQLVPLLTGLLQLGIAAALFWRTLEDA